MKKFRTYLSLMLVLCLVFPLLAACNTADNDSPADTSAPDSADRTVLTNIFAETPSQLPEEARVYKEVIPLYDRDAGTVTEFLLEWKEAAGEDGIYRDIYTGWLYTLSEDGELLDKTEIPLPDDFFSLGGGIVLPDTVICTGFNSDIEPVVWKTDRESGEITSTGSIREMTGTAMDFDTFGIKTFDGEGRVYWTDYHTVFVLNPDFTLSFVHNFPTKIYTMARGADGNVWVTFNAGMESCAAVIDPETKELGTCHTFTRSMDSGNAPTHYLLNSSMNAGESAYNFFYYDLIGALWGVTVTGDGTLEETQVFDLFNSGISKLNTGSAFEHELSPVAFVTDELFLTWKNNGQGWANRRDELVLHRRTEDIDMSKQSVITIAYAYPLQASAVEHITEFKRTHLNVGIVWEDYSQYATEDNGRAGEEKLCFDLVNGFVEPDIVITDASYALYYGIPMRTLRDDMVITQLYRNNLYVDLVPYLERDEELNFGNLFGCVRRLFDDGNGGMWGISTDLEANTLLGSPALSGKFPSKGYWNLTEMLDFLDSLPEGREKIYSYSQTNAYNNVLTTQGYGYFIDGGTCSFDSAEFLRYLEFIETLPEDYKEWDKTSPAAYLRNIPPAEREQALNKALGTGEIALTCEFFSSCRNLMKALFPEEYVPLPVGFAAESDTGFRVHADTTYIITTYADDPGLCFELLKSFFVCEMNYMDTYSIYHPLFTRKDHFRTAMDECAELFTDIRPLTEEEYAGLYEILDNAGSPILEDTPDDVWNIVNEEMSAFLSGMGTAEECAKKIQSRVSIWLAEHE